MIGKLKDITSSINKISLERRCSFHECVRQCKVITNKSSINSSRSFHSLPVTGSSLELRCNVKIESNPQCSFTPAKLCHRKDDSVNDQWIFKLRGIIGDNYILICKRNLHDWKNGSINCRHMKNRVEKINQNLFHKGTCSNMEQNISSVKEKLTLTDRICRKDVVSASVIGPQSREFNGIRNKIFQSSSVPKDKSGQKIWNSKSFDGNPKVITDFTKLGDSFDKRDENTIQSRTLQIQDTTGFLPQNKVLSNIIVNEKQHLSKQLNTKSQQALDTDPSKIPRTLLGQTKGPRTSQVNRKSIDTADSSKSINNSKQQSGELDSRRKKVNFIDLRNTNPGNKYVIGQGSTTVVGSKLKTSPQDSPRGFPQRHEPMSHSAPSLPLTANDLTQTINDIVRNNQDEGEREPLTDETGELRRSAPGHNIYGKTQKDALKPQRNESFGHKNVVEQVLSDILRKNKLKQMLVDFSSVNIHRQNDNRIVGQTPTENEVMRDEKKKQLINYVLKKKTASFTDCRLSFSHKSLCLSDIERYKQSKRLERHRAMKTIYDAHWDWDKLSSAHVFDNHLPTAGTKREPNKLRPADIAEKIRLKAKIVNSKELKDETIKPQLYCKNSLALGVAQMPIAPCMRVVNRQRGKRIKKQFEPNKNQVSAKSVAKHRAIGSFFKNSSPLWTEQRMLSNHGGKSEKNRPKRKPKIDIKGALKYLLDFKSRLSMSKD